MTYEEALQKINSRLLFGIKPGLERIEALCKKLGDPQKKPRFVHVAGTNGKGTTCTLIASVLKAAGYRTGLYTSPYVLDFRERFRIDGEMIPEAELIEEVERVSPIADELEAKGDRLSEFEDVNAVMSALSSLSKSNRDVMLLSIIGDMQSDQIAQILGIPPTTVRSRITRSLKYLKKALSGATKNSHVGHLYSEYEENDSKEGRNGELPGQKQAKA